MTPASDIERTSLDAHVSICEMRYQALERRIASVEGDLREIRLAVMEIRDQLQRLPMQQQDSWSQAKSGLIGVLLAVTGFLLVQTLF